MIEVMTSNEGLAKLREVFPPNQISKLPKPVKSKDDDKGKCERGSRYSSDGHFCGGCHSRSMHLDYVGHAALTDRLLDADLHWSWEPLCMAANGLPVMDDLGGMWIKLTVCGVTRLGYGHAGSKIGGDAIKEVIGDALRNAAMRFGAALELWHKGELHLENEITQDATSSAIGVIAPLTPVVLAETASIFKNLAASKSVDILRANFEAAMQMLDASEHAEVKIIANQRKSELLKKVIK